MKKKPSAPTKRLLVEELEPRLLLSADLSLGLAVPDEPALAGSVLEDKTTQADELQSSEAILQAAIAEQVVRNEIVFVDAGVAGYQSLIDDLNANPQQNRHIEIVVLDSSRDGIAQITEALAGQQQLDAIHILSHGSEAGLQLGSTWLDSADLSASAAEVAGWSDALTESADILIYGCDLAAGVEGRALLQGISNLTGADVAASDDLTGAAALRGDWVLEFSSGSIEASVAFSAEAQSSWNHTLPTPPVAANDPEGYSDFLNSLGPLGHWRLSESSGTTVYDETGANNGTNVNGSAYGQTGGLADEPANTATAFDGSVNNDSGDFVEIAHDPSYLIDNGTIQLWFNTSDVTQDAGLFSKDSTDFDTGGHVTISVTPTSHVSVRIQSTTASYTIESITALTADEWHHAAFTFGSGGMQLFVDGNLEATNVYTGGLGASSGGSGNADPIAIGASTAASGDLVTTGTDKHFEGMIDEVALFGTELTAEEIRNLYGSASQNYTIYQDTALNTSVAEGVLANDYDADNDPLTAVLVDGPSNAQSFTLNADGSFNYTPAAGFTGTDTFTYRANDGSSNSNLATVTVTVDAVATANAIWVSTSSNASAPGADGLPGGWQQGEVLEFGGVDLALGSSTDGNFSSVIDFDPFAAGSTDVDALHLVTTAITVGGGANTFDLERGDVLVSFNQNETIRGAYTVSGSNEIFQDSDLMAFRPDTPGDYSSGTFHMLLDNVVTSDLLGVTLVEQDTRVGDADLTAGSFLLAREVSPSADVYLFDPTGVGLGTTTGTTSTLIDGSALNINSAIRGLELIERTTSIGGVVLDAGTLLFSLQANDSSVGSNNLTTVRQDIFAVTVTRTGIGTTTGVAAMLLDGSDVNLDNNPGAENVGAIALVSDATNNAPTSANNTVVTSEDADYIFTVADFRFDDLDGDALTKIQITELETIGNLQLSGIDVTLDQEIDVADIVAGNLRFVPIPNQNGAGYDSFEFRVHDGREYSVPASMMVVLNATFDADAEGFSYADDTFGTSNPTYASGTYEATGGLSGGGLRVYLGGASTGAPVSGGWSNTFSLAQAETVTVSLQYRLIIDARYESDEFGEAILEVDGVRYGADLNNSLFHQVGDGNAGSDDDSGWRYAEFDIALGAGNHTLTVGAYNNKSTESFEWVEAYFDDINVEIPSNYTMTVDVDAVNDAPINTVPAAQNVDEDVALTFSSGGGNGISIADVDANGGDMEVTLNGVNGLLTLNGIAGLNFTTGTGSGESTMVFTGTVAAINTALEGMTFDPTPGYNGAASVQIITDDQGNTGSGGPLTDDDTIAITVDAVNDAPINAIPGPQSTDEDVTLTFSSGGGNGISIADVDANGGDMEVTLNATNGLLTLSGIAGLTFTSGDGSDDATMVFTGTIASINAALEGMTFDPAPEYNGAASVRIITDDQGSTGAGGSLTDDDTVAITVNAIDDAPINSVPGGQTVDEDNTLTFSAGGGNAISIADVDANGGDMEVTLNATNGTLTLSGVSGLSFTTGDGSDDAMMVFTGTIANINAALEGMTFDPTPDFAGAASLQIITDDQGNTGAGGPLTDDDTIAITVNAINDAPINSVPAAQAVNEDTALIFSAGGGNAISIADVDANGADMEVTLSATNGLLTLSGTAGLTFTSGDGSDDTTMVFTGTMASINAALEGMTFDPAPEYNGAASVRIITDDQGSTGAGGSLTDDDTVAITVNAIDDAPINSVPGGQAVDEDNTLTFSAGGGNAITISDIDANGADMEVTLVATNGTLTLSGVSGLSFTTGDGSDDATMVFTGTIANINAALEGMTFDPTPDYNGAASVQIITDDQGNTGTGGPLTDDDTVAITVNAIDDAPVNSVPGAQAVNEDTALIFSAGGGNAISIADVDANGADMEVTLSATNGLLTLSGTAGLTFTSGDGSDDSTMVFTGTIASINAALEGMSFDPTPEYNGAASVRIITDDQGSTGTGGPLTDDDTVAITVNAIDDAPINSVPGGQAVDEESTLTFSAGGGNAITISDIDANGADMEVTLVATNGTLTLGGVSGLSFTTGDGSDDTTMVFTGSIANINAALEGMTFDPTPDFAGAASLQIITDDQGNTGAGGPLTDDDTIAITVNGINDAPINSVPGGQSVDEDNTLTFSAGGGNAITISDVDANGADMEVTLVATNGTLTLSGVSGLSFTTGDGTTDATMVFTGTVANINAALEGMTFDPTPDYNGAASVQIITDDQGNTGSGGPLTDDDTIAITVNVIDDAPVNVVPAAQSVDEDTTLTFSAGGGNAIIISDVDANGADMEVTLVASNGTLTLSGVSGLSFTTGDGTTDATMVFTGTIASINAALEGMSFDPTPDYNGAASVQIITDDQGNTGAGGPLTDDDTVAITVNAIDDAPVNVVPAAQSVDEDTTLTFSVGGGNAISITDVDANGGDMEVTLSATNGLLTLSGTAGLTFTSGDGSDDATMVFTGTIASINAALEGMTFDPTLDYNGAASVQIITDDQGNTGAGGPLTDDDTVAITVNAIDDAPINSVPGGQSVDEDNTLTFSAGGGNAITISDVDANGGDMEVTLSATNGLLTLSGTAGLTFTSGDGTADATMVFTGTIASINAALEGMTFDPTPEYNGAASVQIITDDQGNTGAGGPLTDDDTVAITVNAIDDAPINSVPGGQSVDEDNTLTFSAGGGNAVTISDIDANGGDMEVTLVATNGTLTLSGVSGLSFTTGDGTTDTTMVFTGTIASINAALEGLTFDPTPDYNGAASVQIITDDQGNTGAGGPLTDDDTIAITVNAIDDAPVNIVPPAQSVNEDTTLTFSAGGGNAISITDVDANGGDMEVTLSATNGLLTLSGTAGLTFTSGDGSDDTTMVFTGTIASINAALEGMTFDPTPEYNGAASVRIITDDQGSTGAGGPLSDDDTVAITVNAIDDAPINSVPGGQAVDEESTLTFSAGGGNAITISDIDANGGDMEVTLNATNGTLTLGGVSGLSFTTGDGSDDTTMVFTGTIANINAALEGMTFDPTPDFAGAASLQIITDDQGNTGAGGPLTDDDTIAITVNAINDAPINSVPGGQSVDEDTTLTFSAGGGNAISIADVDANGGDMEVTLNTTNGLLTLSGTAGLTFTSGDGSDDAMMVFTGTVANINAALEGMTFDPTPDYNGAASVQIITDDQGSTGSGGPLTDDDTIAITVNTIDDAPINSVPGGQSVDEDNTLTFSAGGGNAISIADVDANGGDMEVTLSATNGLLTLSGTAGLTFTSGDGSDDTTMVFTGTIANINAALEGMTFDPTPEYNGAASVQIITDDQGSTGAGGPLTDDDTVAITVNAIDDAPINSVPGGQSVDEDTTLTFSAGGGNAITISDIDANGAGMEVTLVATNGTLTLSGVSGLSFTTGDGTTDTTMVFTGTIASINAALEGMTFDPTPDYNGAASVQIITNDQGNTGAGGPLTDDDTVSITVNAIDDAPVNVVPPAQSVNEDTTLTFSAGGGNAITISDVDANGGDMEVTLNATNGLLTLSGTAGLTFTSGDGTADVTMVLTGTVASINAALEGMTFDPTPEYNGAASVRIITDDQGSTGVGGPLTDDDTVAITVNAIDDAPINSVPGGQSVDEDNTLTFSAGGGNAISIADVDANGGDMEVTLVATNGTLNLGGVSGLSFSTGDGSDDATMVFTGTIANINAALEGMTFDPTPDYNGAASVQIITDDQGNTGAGGPLSDDDTIAITVNAIDDAPINSVPGGQSVDEDNTLTFSAGGGNAISIADVDANGGDMEVTLNATNGLLTLSGTAGLTFTIGDGSDDATMVFTGTIASINAALEGMTFDPTPDYNGAASVQIITDDQGNTGAGGPLSDDDTVAITVNAIDDAPINSVPGGQTVDEDTTLTFSAGGGNAITISDIDANGGDMEVTLSATNGLLTLSGTAGLTFTSGDGSDDTTMVFTGTIASINAALEGMAFDPTPNYNGAASVQIITDDQGNTGAGGPLTDDDTVAITVNAIDDAPINSVPGAQAVNEDTALIFSAGGGNAISIADVDANGGDMEVTLNAINGLLTLSGTAGLTFTIGDGSDDTTMVFTGTIASINAALEGMTFDPTPDYNGAASVQIITDDQGNTGAGGPLTDDDTVAITVNAIDDAPINSVPGGQSVDEDNTLTFSAGGGNAISITDVDANGGDMEVTLSATNGLLTLSGTAGLTFTSGDGSDDATMVFTGTIASINAALEGMTFDPTPEYNGAASVQIITDDQGNTGAGGPLTDDDTIAITVNAIDDAPVNVVPAAQSVNEDTTLTFSAGGGNAISITDVDANGGDMEVTLSATNGLLTLSGTAGLTFTSGDGSDDTTMVFTGTIASINAALEGMTFDPTPEYNGAASVWIITDDQGSTGAGGPLSDDDTVAITVNAIDDAPINSVPGGQAVDEESTLTFSAGGGNAITISDIDANGGDMEVTLSATNGLLTLSGTAGLTFTSGDGSDDATMVFTGTIANINAALEGMTFDPTPDFAGAASLQIITDDQGNTGAGGPLTDDDTIAITVNAINDAPINSVPGAQAVNEDTALVFSAGGGNAISIADIDANGSDMEVTLNATNGLLTLSGTAGLTFTSGDGSDDATMVFTGTVANINAALEGMTFDPTPDYNGAASVQIITDDQGNTGAGGPLTDDDTVAITILDDNDAPVNTVPGPQAVDEESTLTFSAGGGNAITISDVDANGADMEVTLSATNGLLTLSGTAGLTFTSGDGSDDATMVFTGTLASINAALEGMTFDPTPDFAGVASLQIITDDQGNTGAGGPLTDDDTVAITVNAINDAPINSVPGAQGVNEDTALIFSSAGGNAISIADVDANGGDMEVTLNATNGTLTLSGVSGLSFTTGDGTTDATMVFTGTIASINAALEGMTFDPVPQFNGSASVQIITNDQGNTGSGGPLTDNDTVSITVFDENDAPVNIVPGPQTIDEDNTLTFSAGGGNAITISDVDANGADMQVTLNATNGLLTLSGTAGLTFTIGDGSDDATMVFTGTIASINAAFEGMTFDPTPEYNGAASVQIITDDQGNIGSGGPLTDDDTVAITINPINDVPIVLDTSISTAEDTPYLSAIGVNDLLIGSSDADGDSLSVTTTPITAPSNGTLALNSDGTFTYTPDANFFGSDAFVYEVTDANGGIVQATVTIDVTSVNDAPTVLGSSITLDEDVPYAAMLGVDDLLINSFDVDGDALTVSATPVTGPSSGVLILNGDGSFTYTPDADTNGPDSFVYEITDGNGASAQAVVAITVNSINDAPVASDDALNAQVNSSGTIDEDDLMANDIDVDGDTITLDSLTQPSNGFVSLNPDGTIVYVPDDGFIGSDSFTYTISDSSGMQSTGLVVIDVAAPGVGDDSGNDDSDSEDVIQLEPIDSSTLEEGIEEPAAATSAFTPTVRLLVTPEDEFSDLDVSSVEQPVDLTLLVDGEIDDSSAEILITKAQSLYNQSLNSITGLALGSFELASLDPASLAQALDSLRREISGLDNSEEFDNLFVLQVSTGLGAVLSVGFVSWILRGGALAATLLSTVPMWKGFDPLPMLMGRRRDDDDEDRETNEGTDELAATTELRELHLERMFSMSGRFKTDEAIGKKSK